VLRTQRRETIRQLAFSLAASGDFADWRSIERKRSISGVYQSEL
jgi:hypothetical protein